MIDEERYQDLLKKYLEEGKEEYLVEAGELGKELGMEGEGMEDVIQLHFDYLDQAETHVDDEWMIRFQEFLFEVAVSMAMSSEAELSEALEPVYDSLYSYALQSYREMMRAKKDLEVLNRVVRHDIRNDLNLIFAWTFELEEHLDDEDRELVNRIKETSQHVIELTKTARDFVETIDGEETELLEVNASKFVEQSVEKAREVYTDTDFDLHVDNGAKIEGTALFSSIARNLVTNAVIHNDKTEPEIEVSLKEKKGSALLEVADNGPGVPDNQKEEIFGKGEKGLESPGTGMGLYLVNTLVQSYGGEVWVEDNEPEGSVFKVEIPRYEG